LLGFAALGDQLGHELVTAAGEACEGPHRRRPTGHALQRGHQRQRVLAERQDAGQRVAQLAQPRAGLQPEHRSQDDLQRQRLKARMQRGRAPARPRRHFPLGQLGDRFGQTAHLLAVERREHQLALLHVHVLVEQDQRVAPDQGLEHLCPLAGMDGVWRGGEQLLDVVGIGQHHERRLKRP
jgi:hypothetical protein